MKSKTHTVRSVLALCTVAFYVGFPALGRDRGWQENDIRKMWDTEFSKKRPASKKAGSKKRPASTPRSKGVTGSFVGVTVWRLRPSSVVDDQQTRLLSQGTGESQWTPERVKADTMLGEGDRVRLAIEVPRSGFLYVIDREKFGDGTMGQPYLIFPTTRTRGGKNKVTAGRLVEIPAQEDDPSYFTVKRSRADQVGEAITLLVTARPLDLEIGPNPTQLSSQQFAEWEKQWAVKTESLELAGGEGRTWTRAEKEAGADPTRLLTQDDPPPQTIYRMEAKPNRPVMVTLELKIAK